MRKLLSLTLLALAGSTAFAGGYRVNIQGQKQLAMGHTGVAVVNSAEVAFFNPAGMAYLDKKFNLSVGGSALMAKTRFQNSEYNWTAGTDNLGTPFNVSRVSTIITGRINKASVNAPARILLPICIIRTKISNPRRP